MVVLDLALRSRTMIRRARVVFSRIKLPLKPEVGPRIMPTSQSENPWMALPSPQAGQLIVVSVLAARSKRMHQKVNQVQTAQRQALNQEALPLRKLVVNRSPMLVPRRGKLRFENPRHWLRCAQIQHQRYKRVRLWLGRSARERAKLEFLYD